YGPQNDVTLKMPAFEWVHVQLHQQKGMISLSPPTICNSAVSSNAAPQALVESSRIAAPFNSDSTKRDNSEASWESRVKGHLNRYKRYPGDARKRARTGTAVVTFTVNTEGTIVSSFLEISSGTFSLDREAIAVLERAQPLPKPPPEILEGGLFKVKMPITFKLKE
ncbi:energy transducer TonB family protein, partial [Escherichia coli]|uniref:energy transducer TonB family protein n=1 Tax=Escherichia coli TaxID=562 RepID=UPI002024D493